MFQLFAAESCFLQCAAGRAKLVVVKLQLEHRTGTGTETSVLPNSCLSEDPAQSMIFLPFTERFVPRFTSAESCLAFVVN